MIVMIPLSPPVSCCCSLPASPPSGTMSSHCILMLLDAWLMNLSYTSVVSAHVPPSHWLSLQAASSVVHPLSVTILRNSYFPTRFRSSSSSALCRISPTTSCVTMARAERHPNPPCSRGAQKVTAGVVFPVLHACRKALVHAFSSVCSPPSFHPARAAEYLNIGIMATCTTQCICAGEY